MVIVSVPTTSAGGTIGSAVVGVKSSGDCTITPNGAGAGRSDPAACSDMARHTPALAIRGDVSKTDRLTDGAGSPVRLPTDTVANASVTGWSAVREMAWNASVDDVADDGSASDGAGVGAGVKSVNAPVGGVVVTGASAANAPVPGSVTNHPAAPRSPG